MTAQHAALISLFLIIPAWFIMLAIVFLLLKEQVEAYFDRAVGVPAYAYATYRAPVSRHVRGRFEWHANVASFTWQHSIKMQANWR